MALGLAPAGMCLVRPGGGSCSLGPTNAQNGLEKGQGDAGPQPLCEPDNRWDAIRAVHSGSDGRLSMD